MKDFLSEINADCFYQMSRYYLVNMDCIQNLKEESIVLKNGFEVFLPKRDLKKVKQKINDYIWKSMRSQRVGVWHEFIMVSVDFDIGYCSLCHIVHFFIKNTFALFYSGWDCINGYADYGL